MSKSIMNLLVVGVALLTGLLAGCSDEPSPTPPAITVPSPTFTATPSAAPVPTDIPTATPTAVPMPTPTPVRTATPVPTATPTNTPTSTLTSATVPGAPTGLTATSNEETWIDLSWTAPSDDGGVDITGYRIEVSFGGGAWGDLAAITGAATTYSHTGLRAGTTRRYRVSTINSAGTGPASNIATGTVPATVPGVPTGLTATSNEETWIELSWTAPSDDGGVDITGYRIEVSSGGGAWGDLAANTEAATTYSHTGLRAGTTRRYRVSAINSAGTGPASNIATGTVPATVPRVPTGLTATSNGETWIELSWIAPSDDGGVDITGHRIEVSSNGAAWRDLATNAGAATTYFHTGLRAGTTRRYRVSAINSTGTGPVSNIATGTVPATVPGMPTGLTATSNGETWIELSWTAPSDDGGVDITGYRIEVSSGRGTWGDLAANIGAATTYSHTGLKAGTTRHYRVSAINSAGTGPASNIATGSATPAAFYSALLQQFTDLHGIGAAALGIMRQGEIVYEGAVGHMDDQHRVPVRQDTMMRLASVSKPITAAAVRKLASDGILALDDQVFDLGQSGSGLLEIDPFPQLGDPRLADITVLHLLQHRGGWDPRVATNFVFREIEIAEVMSVASPPGRENTVRYVLGQPLQFSPGSGYAYSNVGYLILGLVIEEVSGQDYMTYVRENIFAPLGVPTGDVIQGRTLQKDRSEREPWYDGEGRSRNVFDPSGPLVRRPDGGWHHEAAIGWGGLVGSTRAILEFLDAYEVFGDDIGRGRRGGDGTGWQGYHTGDLSGTNSLAFQRGDGINYVVLFNRRASAGPSYVELFREIMEEHLADPSAMNIAER